MRRSGAVLALCVSGLLTLTACGSGKSPPASAGSTLRASPASSSTAASDTADIVHIGPYTQVFATPLPTDPAQAKVVEGFRRAQVLWQKSDLAWKLVTPVTEYVTGRARYNLLEAVIGLKTRHVVPTGSDRMFMTRVAHLTSSRATITTCDDGSKTQDKNPHTGRVDRTLAVPPDKAYLFETWHMVKLSGHWAITAFTLASLPDPRAKPCQP